MSTTLLRETTYQELDRRFRYVLHTLSFYVVPLTIAFVVIIGLAFWSDPYAAIPDRTLKLKILQSEEQLAPADAFRLLKELPAAPQYETKLSESPVWMAFRLSPDPSGQTVAEFPSRHAKELACWDTATFAHLGSVTRSVEWGSLSAVKAGFVLKATSLHTDVICRGTFYGPARLTALQWSPQQFNVSIEQYHRRSGLLDGGLLALALFAMVIALINREKMYVLFGAWLFLNWRVAALSAGSDIYLLGQSVPEDWLLYMRAITIALYATITFELYLRLFKENLVHSRFAVPLKLTHWMCLPLLAAAVLLPFRLFLPVMWVMVGAGLLLMIASGVCVMLKAHSRVASWYAASFSITFLANLSEMLAASFGMREFVTVFNSATAALASSILAAFAIAERMRIEHAQRLEAQKELEHTYEVMPVGLFTLDIQGRLLSANPALTRMLGIAPGNEAWDNALMHFFEQGAWSTLFDSVHQGREAELELLSKDGSRHFLVKATLSRGKIEGFIQDVTEKAKATVDLLFMVNHDPLTKVFNRRGIEAVFRPAAERIDGGRPMTFGYLDLDRFRLINELFGHSAGDEVLTQVCERIIPILATNHHIGRVGGDEFVIVMPDTAIPLAELICRGIVNAIDNAPYRVGDKAFHVRGSIGLIEVTSGMTMKDAVSAADQACREAKNGHGEGMVVYDRDSAALYRRQAELDMVAQLSADDATQHLFLEMQPIMALKNPYESLNFEVLLRMRDPTGAVIPAGRVIAAAEKSGLTGMIDRWVLTTTLGWIEENVSRLDRTQFVNMNLSGASLNDERFIQDTLLILEAHPAGARYLCIEITESVALHDLDNTRRFIEQVRKCGVRIALDDFGAGYTSFSYLKELPADVVKIDGQFVLSINEHPANMAIVEAIVNLAYNLGMKTIAEWAEDAATAKTLADIGVDYVQGFIVSRSQPPEKILSATSAASFITDETMLMLTRHLATDRLPTSEGASQLVLRELD